MMTVPVICVGGRGVCVTECVFCAYDSSAAPRISASGHLSIGREGSPACE